MSRRRDALWRLLSVVWTGAILFLAAQEGGKSHSLSTGLARLFGELLHPDFAAWRADVQAEWIGGVEELLRKLAHYFEFAILGALVFFALSALGRSLKSRKPGKPSQCAFMAFYISAMIATASEVLQLSAANRHAGAMDVALDCLGIISGILFLLFKTKRRENAPSGEATNAVSQRRKG